MKVEITEKLAKEIASALAAAAIGTDTTGSRAQANRLENELIAAICLSSGKTDEAERIMACC
jgi:hypothetical protein